MNQRMELPVNLPDTAEVRGVARPFPENSGQNASGDGGKGKTADHAQQRLIERYGLSPAIIPQLETEALEVFRAWKRGECCRFGAVVETPCGSDAVVVRLISATPPINGVFVPRDGHFRTFLPSTRGMANGLR